MSLLLEQYPEMNSMFNNWSHELYDSHSHSLLPPSQVSRYVHIITFLLAIHSLLLSLVEVLVPFLTLPPTHPCVFFHSKCSQIVLISPSKALLTLALTLTHPPALTPTLLSLPRLLSSLSSTLSTLIRSLPHCSPSVLFWLCSHSSIFLFG